MSSPISNRDKIEEIKDQLDIIDVIGKTVTLTHRGKGKYTGTVGIKGKTGASLNVDKFKQCWHDWKNGIGGDVLDWIGYNSGYGDTRGVDFPEVIRTASELAGVELSEITEAEKDTAKEKAEIHNLFTEAVEIYHKNLTPELYDLIQEKWGISRATVDCLRIGYATRGKDLEVLDEITLKKSGLVYVNNGRVGREVFRGRIIFPYWKNGKVVYLIGRETEETPENECKKGMKYKKLLVHKDGHEYVSPSVRNSYFYGEDSLRGSDYCIITEGVADCIAMLQAGFPCISPVTVRFREEDHLKLINLTKRLKRVYICNDNEANSAGLKGALNTATALEGAEIETRLIELPKPEDIDKIDIADYMKEHSPEDFKGLMDSSPRLWECILEKQVISANSKDLERLRAYKDFILNDLRLMQNDEWEVFVNNEVPKKFLLNKKSIKNIVAEVRKNRQSKKDNLQEEKTEEEDKKEERLNDYPKPIREAAEQILNEGDPFKFILNTWSSRHVGDKNLGENCLCAIASTYILTSDMGLHVKPSGESGKGKSDAMQQMLNLLPEHKYISGSLSSKALFYNPDLKKGTIIYSDDAHFNDDTIATIKQSTSNFQAPTCHRTVVNGEYKSYWIPQRCSYWFTSVDGIGDEQLANRFLNADVDGSKEQDERVYNHIKQKEAWPYSLVDDDLLICRCIFDILDKEQYAIKIPFVCAIEWRNKENRRNFQKFLDIIRAVTFYNVKQRRKVNGYYLADIEDFERAVDIYTGTSKNNATNLTSREIEVLKFIAGKNTYDKDGNIIKERPVTFQDLMDKFHISRNRARDILFGKNNRGGMLAKVAQLNEVDKSITTGTQEEERVTTSKKEFVFTGKKIGLEIYDTVATLDYKVAWEKEKEFIIALSDESITQCNPGIPLESVILKTRTVNRIKDNITHKRKNERKVHTDSNSTFTLCENIENNENLAYSVKQGYSVRSEEESSLLTTFDLRNQDDCTQATSGL